MIQLIPLAALRPNSLNPRLHIDEQALGELAASIAHDGILENLIVRPAWQVGLVTAAELASAVDCMAKEKGVTTAWEVVSGDRRLAAALRVLPAKRVVPCYVVEKTDPEALRINLAEQMQRNQLVPLEEAEGFAKLLEYRASDGGPLHTVGSLAESLGVAHDYVLARLKLRGLPAVVKKALAADKLPLRTALVVATVPGAEAREAFAAEVMAGDVAMSAEEAQTLLQERYVVDLRGAPFDGEDASLVPAAGKCSVCKYRTGNQETGRQGARAQRCTNTTCYREKCLAHAARVGLEALEKGVGVLTIEDSRKYFEPHRGSEVRVDGEWADCESKPFPHLLKAEVEDVPTWGELVERAMEKDLEPEVVLAIDSELRPRWLVRTGPLMAAAEKFGEPIFRGAKAAEVVVAAPRAGEDEDEAFKRARRELAEKQRLAAVATAEEKRRAGVVRAAAVRAVHAGLAKGWTQVPLWDVLLDLTLAGDSVPVWHLLAEVLVMKPETPSKKLRAALDKRRPVEQQALVPLLGFAPGIALEGVDHPGLRKLAKLAGVSLAKVEKETLAAMAEAGKKQKEAA